MGLFLISGVAFLVGIILIVLLKTTAPPPPQDQLQFDSSDDIPPFLKDREAFEKKCAEFLDTMRQNARFVLKVVTIDGPMPHNKELKVQAGGCLALQNVLSDETPKATQCHNIYATLKQALIQFGHIDDLPYNQLIKGIITFQPRPKRKKH